TTMYYVKITTPSGCTATDSIQITAHVFEANAGSDKTLVCGGEAQLEVTTNYSGIGALSYAWTPSAGLNLSNIANPKASVSTPTAFSVVVTTPNGCKAYDTVNVLVGTLKADAGPDKTITCGGQGQLEVTTNFTGTGSLTYAWTPSSGLNLSNIYNPIVSVAQTTTFVVKTQSGNGCVAYDTIEVVVNPLTVNVGLDKLLSCGKSIQLDSALTNYNGNGTLTYSWSPKIGLSASNIANPVTTKGGLTYTLSVFSPFGACKATDQVKVDYIPLVGTDICIVALDSTNKNVVVWPKAIEGAIDSFLVYKETAVVGTYAKIGSVSKNAPTQFRDVNSQPDLKSAKYKISMKDTCGVETAMSDAHTTMYLTVTKGTGSDLNLKWTKYEGVNVSSYIIYRGISKTNLQFIGSTAGANDTYTDSGVPAGTLYYQIEFTNLATCNSTNPLKKSRSNIASSSPIGIYEYENNFSFTVYPNPVNELLTINVDLATSKNITLNIYNSLGALVRTQVMEHNTQQLNVSDLTSGFYIVELKTSSGSSKQKLTIQR
ncbi:MAG TPA: T9SS type A sorting domain-containing protein, partial [Bacteroidia bacterium]|nr:T9SS type A sorting domain-containing protein [Bacteroidia bacterium]